MLFYDIMLADYMLCEIKVVEKASHQVMEEKTEEVTGHVQAFIDALLAR